MRNRLLSGTAKSVASQNYSFKKPRFALGDGELIFGDATFITR